MRRLFVDTMKQQAPQHDFSFLSTQKGMFSFSGLTPMQVDELKTKHALYIVVSGGRINVAGMTEENMDRLTRRLPRCCNALLPRPGTPGRGPG